MSVPVQRTSAVDLQKLVEHVPAWVEEKGMLPLAAVPEGPGRHVLLEGDVVNAAGFIDLAHTCGARVLYHGSEVFTADEFAVLDDADEDEHEGGGAEDQLSADARRELKRLRRAARSRDGQITAVVLCFVAEGVPHYWGEEASWHTELTGQWAEFTQLHRVSRAEREQDARELTAAEVERMTDELADDPEFRAATKRSHHHDIAATAYPAPSDADDDQLQEHQRIVRWAASKAIDLVEGASRRVYAGYERDLTPLAEEITAKGVLDGATTIGARTLLVSEFLIAKSGGYPPPKRFTDLLMLRPQLRKPGKTDAAKSEQLPLS